MSKQGRATKKSLERYRKAQFKQMMRNRAYIGQCMENVVERVLKTMVQNGQILTFKRYRQNSRQDREGKDFKAVALVSGRKVSISFGITISYTSVIRHRCKHPDVPQLLMEPTAPDKRIAEKILGLFDLTDD